MLVMTGQRPGRPNHPKFTVPLWALTQRCWVGVPQDRPEMEEVIKVLKGLSVFSIFAFTWRTFNPHALVEARAESPKRCQHPPL